MTDIVKQLRQYASRWITGPMADAADEIERLRAALQELMAADDAMLAFLVAARPEEMGEKEWDYHHSQQSQRKREATKIARAALGEPKP